jgi:radical S-adenosyl methionine domain-containing protein 2
VSTGPSLEAPVESVNFHLWQPCNMRCAFCFGRFDDVRAHVLPRGHLPRSQALELVARLGRAGFQKINFAGGEPFLCPWLADLVEVARGEGMATSVVTNGSLVSERVLSRMSGMLDWLAVSVDSVEPATLKATGRWTARHDRAPLDYEAVCQRVVAHGIHLKINTVVHRANWREDLSRFILAVRPIRWKVMQVLRIASQNAASVGPRLITDQQFDSFVARHRAVQAHGVVLVVERNEDMIGSYAMVDPAGRFIDNTRGTYLYSDPILECGVEAAIGQVRISREKFLARGGSYDWSAAPTRVAS